jgi:tetratricopeptide (TPR) repeat protein
LQAGGHSCSAHENHTAHHGPNEACGCSGDGAPRLSAPARLLILVEIVAVAVAVGHPLIARSTYNRAASFYAVQMPEKALRYCRKTLALAPDHADAWELIAYCQDMQGRPGEALRSFDMAIGLDPKLASSCVESALLMVREGEYRAAIPRFRQTEALDPGNVTAARFPILCFAALGETDRAIRECNLVLQRFPDDEVTQKWLGKLRNGEMGTLQHPSSTAPAKAPVPGLDVRPRGS